jgi:hypothetical protein
MAVLALIFGIAYLPLQAAAWMKWKGAWFHRKRPVGDLIGGE